MHMGVRRRRGVVVVRMRSTEVRDEAARHLHPGLPVQGSFCKGCCFTMTVASTTCNWQRNKLANIIMTSMVSFQ